MLNKHLFIVNLNSGNKKSKLKLNNFINNYYNNDTSNDKIIYTKSISDLKCIDSIINDYKYIIVVGGDGTVFSLVQKYFTKRF